MFNKITGLNEPKTLIKHISCKCKCHFDGREFNSNQKKNNNTFWCECKKHHTCEKNYIWNPVTCSCENGKYLVSIIDASVIMCDEIIDSEETKTVTTNFNEKSAICNTQNFYILLAFLLITTVLLIIVSIYLYLIKYR